MKKMTNKYFLQLAFWLAALGVGLGDFFGLPSVGQVAPVEAAAQAACNGRIATVDVQRSNLGSTGEDFFVSWRADTPCFTSSEIRLTIRRKDGTERTDRKKLEKGDFAEAFNFLGGGNNPTVSASAVVEAIGVIAAKATRTIDLRLGGATGSNAQGAAQAETFRLSGTVENSNGRGVANVKVAFARVSGIARNVAIPEAVKTGPRGGWQQDGFPNGVTIRVTPSLPGFTFNPPSAVATNTSPIKFVAIPDQAAAPPAQPFSVSGTVLRTNQTAIAGALVSFRIVSGGAGVQVPTPVQSNQNGGWSQSGFTLGATYEVSVFKQGFAFSPNAKTFTAATGNLSFVGLPK
jgi:hypothetical protein